MENRKFKVTSHPLIDTGHSSCFQSYNENARAIHSPSFISLEKKVCELPSNRCRVVEGLLQLPRQVFSRPPYFLFLLLHAAHAPPELEKQHAVDTALHRVRFPSRGRKPYHRTSSCSSSVGGTRELPSQSYSPGLVFHADPTGQKGEEGALR